MGLGAKRVTIDMLVAAMVLPYPQDGATKGTMRMAELIDGPRWGPASKATPKQLVVLCHGLGADGHDLIDLDADWSHALPDAAVRRGRAPFPARIGAFGRQWWSVGPLTVA